MDKISEEDVIRIFVEILGQPKPPYSKIGDDVAHLQVDGRLLVVKSDMLVDKTDVPKGMKMWQAARKSIVMCVSDFAAKGVTPSIVLVSLALPRSISRRGVIDLAKGFRMAKDEFDLQILGGDTNEADNLVIDCHMIGFTNRSMVGRDGARPGDIIFASGFFGYSASGLKILQEGLAAEKNFRRRAIQSVLLPKPRLALGRKLCEEALLSASIDSSDGLAISLYHIAEASEVSIELHTFPTDEDVKSFAEDNRLNLNQLVLYGGEEYEIVATASEERFEEARRLALNVGCSIIEIGKVVHGEPKVELNVKGRVMRVERRGWIHLL